MHVIIRCGERKGGGRGEGKSIAPIIFNLGAEERLMVNYIASSIYWL